MPAPLEGIRVVDFTRYQNGPHATAMLADMGADVLKVEMPGNGDPGRQLGVAQDGFCSYFEALNRGKRSMTLDLRAEGAVEVVHKLIADADVLAENFRPGYLDSIGLGYDDLKGINPQLIYATNSGFGPERASGRAADRSTWWRRACRARWLRWAAVRASGRSPRPGVWPTRPVRCSSPTAS